MPPKTPLSLHFLQLGKEKGAQANKPWLELGSNYEASQQALAEALPRRKGEVSDSFERR